MEAAHAAGAALDLTPRDGDAAALAARVGGVKLPTGSVRLARPGQVTALPGFDAGEWWVQDAAAALPVRLAAPRPGERALDLCAAPGGKTLQLAAAGAEVTAVDVSAPRMERLARNLERCRLEARAVIADATGWDEGGYDVVLLDAPCSATGTIRRHPDLPHAKDLADLGAASRPAGAADRPGGGRPGSGRAAGLVHLLAAARGGRGAGRRGARPASGLAGRGGDGRWRGGLERRVRRDQDAPRLLVRARGYRRVPHGAPRAGVSGGGQPHGAHRRASGRWNAAGLGAPTDGRSARHPSLPFAALDRHPGLRRRRSLEQRPTPTATPGAEGRARRLGGAGATVLVGAAW